MFSVFCVPLCPLLLAVLATHPSVTLGTICTATAVEKLDYQGDVMPKGMVVKKEEFLFFFNAL